MTKVQGSSGRSRSGPNRSSASSISAASVEVPSVTMGIGSVSRDVMFPPPNSELCLECLHRLFFGGGDVEDAMHARDLERGAHLLRETVELQVAVCRAQFPQAGKDGAQSGAVHKLQRAHVENNLAIFCQNRRDIALELFRHADVQVFRMRGYHRDLTDLLNAHFHNCFLSPLLPLSEPGFFGLWDGL